MTHKKIRFSRRKQLKLIKEAYRNTLSENAELKRRCRALETSVKLLRKVLDDATEQRNELDKRLREIEKQQGDGMYEFIKHRFFDPR